MDTRPLVEAFLMKMNPQSQSYNTDYWAWRMNEAYPSRTEMKRVFEAMEQDRVNHNLKSDYGERYYIQTLKDKYSGGNTNIG